jgi:hypothetical protein
MRDLIDALRQHGWEFEGTRLCAPGRTMWLETTAAWPKSLEGFLADMRSRWQRVVATRESVTGEDFDVALADVESAIKAAESLA